MSKKNAYANLAIAITPVIALLTAGINNFEVKNQPSAEVQSADANIKSVVNDRIPEDQSAIDRSVSKKVKLTAGQKKVADDLAASDSGCIGYIYSAGLLATLKSGAAKGLWTYEHVKSNNMLDVKVIGHGEASVA